MTEQGGLKFKNLLKKFKVYLKVAGTRNKKVVAVELGRESESASSDRQSRTRATVLSLFYRGVSVAAAAARICQSQITIS